MNYKQLKIYAETCQIEADKMAFRLIEQQEIFRIISTVQSICDFNLVWLYSISPGVVIHKYSLKFLSDNVKYFNRKLSIKEMIKFDGAIHINKPKDFNQFKKAMT
jgi:hypothetical protein